MINLPHLYYNKPTTPERKPPVVIASKTRITKQQRKNRQEKERERLDAKRHSPGVPPNSCPYIDMTKTIIDDLAAAYERLNEIGRARLNSSHTVISYAVFCLKKKKKNH